MPSTLRLARWASILSLAALVTAVQGGPATAQFFDFFSDPAPPQPAYAPPSAYAPPAGAYRRPSRRARAEVARVRAARAAPARVRYASLPGPAAVRTRRAASQEPREEAKPKLAPRGPTGDPVAALMNDTTLRPGDIVVMPDGAKVFKGGARTPHRPGDFETVRRTKLVDEKTRRTLAALVVQTPPARPGARLAGRPAGEAGAAQARVGEAQRVAASVARRVGP